MTPIGEFYRDLAALLYKHSVVMVPQSEVAFQEVDGDWTATFTAPKDCAAVAANGVEVELRIQQELARGRHR